MVAIKNLHFHFGRTVVTQGADATLSEMGEKKHGKDNDAEVMLFVVNAKRSLLGKHLRLEQGTLCDEDYKQNLEALNRDKDGKLLARIFSSFKIGEVKFWVITEWDESATTILLPDEY